MIRDAKAVFERGEKMQLTYTVRNTHRAVGTRLSSEIVRKFGMNGLAEGHVHVRLRGSAGQDRKSVVVGKSVYVRVCLGCRSISKKRNNQRYKCHYNTTM